MLPWDSLCGGHSGPPQSQIESPITGSLRHQLLNNSLQWLCLTVWTWAMCLCMVTYSWDSRVRFLGVKPWLVQLLAVWPWASYLLSVCSSFLNCINWALDWGSLAARNLCEENFRGKAEWREEKAWMPDTSSLDNFVMDYSCFSPP